MLGPQSTALHRQIERIRAELAAIEVVPAVIELHAPGLVRYRAYVDDLAGHLCGDSEAVQSKAAEAVRGLIETVTVWPGEALATVRVRITDRLAALMNAHVCAGIDGAGSGNRTRAISLGS